MNKVKVAIIGHGHLGKWHAQKAEALETCDLVAIVESNKSAHDEIKKSYPDTQIVSSLDEVIDSIDAAFVITPTSFHHQIVIKLLKHNKHVFCEKPLCSSLEEAAEIQKAAEGKNLLIQVGHSERFHYIWEKFQDYLLNSKNAVIQFTRISPFKGRATDVDVVQDLMIHDIDLLFHLFSAKVESIQSKGIKNLSQHWDHVTSVMNINNGNTVIFNVGRNSCSEQRSLRVTDSRGELFVDLMNNRFELRDNKGEVVESSEYPKRDHLLEEHKHFYESILHNKKAVVDLDDGVNAVNLMHKVLKQL